MAAAVKILGHVVAAKVATGELGARLGLDDDELALVLEVLAAGAHGWRAFECETLAADGTYVGTVRLTTHPSARAQGGGIGARDPGESDAVPGAARRRARPKFSPAQTRVRAALARAPSDPERQNSDLERLGETAPNGENPTASSV
jgi:hypothetical protein